MDNEYIIERDRIENERYARTRYASLIFEAVDIRTNKCNLSQAQTAQMLGLKSHSKITYLETFKHMASMETFLRYLSVFGCTLKIVPKSQAEDFTKD